jgi:hypothetical protein
MGWREGNVDLRAAIHRNQGRKFSPCATRSGMRTDALLVETVIENGGRCVQSWWMWIR